MLIIIRKNHRILFLFLVFLAIGTGISYRNYSLNNYIIPINSEINEQISCLIKNIIDTRNQAILNNDPDTLGLLYNREMRNGLWAYEHELKKMKYLHSWEEKQGIYYKNISSIVFLRKLTKKNDGFTANLMVNTRYEYSYEDSPEITEFFQIGTYHSLDLMPASPSDEEGRAPEELNLLITREWYTDPFADSLQLEKIENEGIRETIFSAVKKERTEISERRKKAVAYADKYCGAASLPEYNFQYNPAYRNYNNLGGDCTNFASQILYEGGSFPKNNNWNYSRGSGSSSWVNASAFHNYMIYSGRASIIASGKYRDVLNSSYKLLPGDYIAYERKGKICHISVVTGADSKGYILVNSHNTDRYRVPWDLGWSNKNIRFKLVRVHY
ncbi:MAG: amidase domain-containing protein [Halanaerobiaceae bacterium]|nr:amidase domain-containing protein [Halanaerobiaceae bacterium]